MGFENFFENAVQCMLLISADERILRVNSAAEELLARSADTLVGQAVVDLLPEEDLQRWKILRQPDDAGAGNRFRFDLDCLRGDGRPVSVRLSLQPGPEDPGEGRSYVITLEDRSALQRMESRLEYLTHFDPLTGLANRGLFRDRLGHALAKACRQKQHLALLLLNINRFRSVNSSCGQKIGDELLKKVAARLKSCVRVTDTVARIDGGRFAILLEDLHSNEPVSPVLRKIMQVLGVHFLIEDQEFFLKFGVGIAFYPEDAEDPEALLRNAETAMCRAREEGRNWYQYYTQEMNAHARERLRLESSLHRALERGEFELYYQPKLEVASGRVVGFEALLRWNHPQCGRIGPGDFIPLLEETGLIHPVGRWVLWEACRQAVLWRRSGREALRMAVNISARQFMDREFIGLLEHALMETGMDPADLELELTESALMKASPETSRALEAIAALGVRIAIDDFGTGYASMEYLKRFPVRSLKIDRGFIGGIVDNPSDAAITLAILTLARSLELDLVAEGVESPEQLELLHSWGCGEVQGFLFAAPGPAVDFDSWSVKDWLCPTPPTLLH
ncbi:hypothetical protein DESUT3_08280 [Desulfuromonas versatilis]|uniref:Diguanylate cyclase/phosphodiesterase with PAS/PAC sensor(S) n=1 Tax=Desulfuromonas versatilis TaxID=2802975 RepID=A0ABN6DW72_9BACT|nr:EAL domain-containing protein [Desulfuromonas versatilis]BCR03759.1 hypothetical protein DESUT3_08280 [Desulfuromonas versatilis]